jgi:hypothetical protein
MTAVDKLLALSGSALEPADPDSDLLLAVQVAASELALLLASDDSDDGKGDDGDGGHADHPTYKALVKKNVPPARAAAMCARSDKKVKATALAQSLQVMLSGSPGRDIGLVTLSATPPSETAQGRREAADEGAALPDGSYPIKSKRQLHSAATLAASRHGNWKAAQALIRKMAPKFGVDVNSLPGFGSQSDSDGEKVAAAMLALARQDAAVAMHHAPMTGKHSHPHAQTSAHDHDHEHWNDNNHGGGPLHRPGSRPAGGGW